MYPYNIFFLITHLGLFLIFQDSSFEIAHVEVWGLGPAVDADEERQNVRPRQPNLEIRTSDVDAADLMSQLM